MSKWIVGILLGLAISFGPSTGFADHTYTEPALVATGSGPDKDTARDRAKELRDLIIDFYEDDLPDNETVVGVDSTYHWDGVQFHITFQIRVLVQD